MYFLRKLLKFILIAFYSALAIVTTASIAAVFMMFKPKPIEPLHHSCVLSIDLTNTIPELKTFVPVQAIQKNMPLTMFELIDMIEHACYDDRVKGLYLKIESTPLSLSQMQDLKEAIERFKKISPHKPVVTFSPSFGDAGNGLVEYYLASFSDKIFMQPMGGLSITGFYAEVPFAKKALLDLGVEAQIVKREDYKSMPDTVLRDSMDPFARENLNALLESLSSQIIDQLSISRKKNPQEIKDLVDKAPLSSQRALESGLIDGIKFESEVLASMPEFKDCDIVKDKLYIQHVNNEISPIHTIALISLEGGIEREHDHDGYNINLGGDKTLVKALKAAYEDPDIKGVLLRINSGGGDAVASETIAHWVQKSKEYKKPLVVSMSDAAASGGYLISVFCDTLVANPATLTGSIGVFSGKFSTQEFWKKWGVTWDSVSIGRHAGMNTMAKPYSESEREKLNESVDVIYQLFRKYVQDGRKLTAEQVLELAKGRVYTGVQAYEKKLVDHVGGLVTSLDVLKEKMNVPKEEALNVWYLPETLGPFEKILSLLDGITFKSFLKTFIKDFPKVIQDVMVQEINTSTVPVIRS